MKNDKNLKENSKVRDRRNGKQQIYGKTSVHPPTTLQYGLIACTPLLSTALGFYDYFLKPHETQSHGPVPILDDQEGVAYCAVNPEDGVHINYTVCAYHGTQTGLDWVASPFIANGSSDCCQCGLCDEGVLGPGVTAILSPSQPNYNKFSVPACLIRSKTVVDGSFVCLAQRKTDVQSSAKQALALFHFQPELPPCQSQTIALIVVSVMVVGLVVLCVVFLSCCCRYKRKCTCESRGDYTVRGESATSC